MKHIANRFSKSHSLGFSLQIRNGYSVSFAAIEHSIGIIASNCVQSFGLYGG